MLHKGHTYRYQGNVRDQEALVDFAVEMFHDSHIRVQVPKMPTLMEELRDLFNYSVAHKGGLLNAMLMKDDEGNVYYSALFSVYILPVIIVYGFYKLMETQFTTEENTKERITILEAANEYERQKIARHIQKHPTLRHKYRKWE